MNTSIKHKTTYFEYLRIISIVAVIFIHVSGSNWYRIEKGSLDWIIQTFFNVSSRFCVCVFCMISGALLLRPSKEITVKDIFSHYIKRIFICMLVWVVFYAAFYTLLNGEDLRYFGTRLFKHPAHLWYLFMLMGMYLALPVLRAISKDREATRYLIWLIIAFCALELIAGTTGFFDGLAGESYGFAQWKAFLGKLKELKVAFIPGYLGLFMLGHYIHQYGLGKWHKRVVLAAIPALLLSSLLTVIVSILTDKGAYTFMLETNPLVILASAGIFAYFKGEKDEASKEEEHSQSARTAVWIGGNSFGIYLVHFAVMEVLSKSFGIDVTLCNPILSVPLVSLLIFAISLAITVVMKKIPVVCRIVS